MGRRTKSEQEERSPSSLASLVKQLQKDHGKEALQLGMGARPGFLESGILSIDYVLGGGLPLGRITEFFGAEGSGKTTVALRLVAKAQEQDILVFFFDAEKTMDSQFASYLGVDRSKVIISNINIGEKLIEIVASLIENQDRKLLIVVDSIAAVAMKDDLKAPIEKKNIAPAARVWNKALPIWNSLNTSNQATVLLINQTRADIGSFIPHDIQPGGKQMKHLSTIRLEVKRGGWIKDKDEDVIGYSMKFRTVKNKLSPPFRQGQVDFYFVNRAFDLVEDMVWAVRKFNVLETSGAGWIKYKGESIRSSQFRELLKTPEIYSELYLETRKKWTEIESKEIEPKEIELEMIDEGEADDE